MSGKGSSPRPFSVAHDEYSKRWDAIFQRDLDPKKQDDAKAEDEAFANIEKLNQDHEYDGPNRNTSNF